MNRISHKGVTRAGYLAVSRSRIIFDESSSTGRGRITSTGMVFAPAAIRNAICGVFAAQKITAVSSNEPCTRDLGRAR